MPRENRCQGQEVSRDTADMEKTCPGQEVRIQGNRKNLQEKKQDTFFSAQMVSHTAYRYRILQDYIATSSLAKEVKNS